MVHRAHRYVSVKKKVSCVYTTGRQYLRGLTVAKRASSTLFSRAPTELSLPAPNCLGPKHFRRRRRSILPGCAGPGLQTSLNTAQRYGPYTPTGFAERYGGPWQRRRRAMLPLSPLCRLPPSTDGSIPEPPCRPTASGAPALCRAVGASPPNLPPFSRLRESLLVEVDVGGRYCPGTPPRAFGVADCSVRAQTYLLRPFTASRGARRRTSTPRRSRYTISCAIEYWKV
jgi:hypothetical protein